MSVKEQEILVDITPGGETVKYKVWVDRETGLDVDENTGVFRTREETEQLVREVYRIGREAMPHELEKYNKWVESAAGKASPLGGGGSNPSSSGPLLKKVGSSSASKPKQQTQAATGKNDDDAQAIADSCRVSGNEELQRGDPRKALRWYRKGLEAVPADPKLHANAAEANIRLRRFSDGLVHADKCLEACGGLNPKADYRRCVCLLELGRLAEAATVVGAYQRASEGAEQWRALEARIASRPRLVYSRGGLCLNYSADADTEIVHRPWLVVPRGAVELLTDSAREAVCQAVDSLFDDCRSDDRNEAVKGAVAAYLSLSSDQNDGPRAELLKLVGSYGHVPQYRPTPQVLRLAALVRKIRGALASSGDSKGAEGGGGCATVGEELIFLLEAFRAGQACPFRWHPWEGGLLVWIAGVPPRADPTDSHVLRADVVRRDVSGLVLKLTRSGTAGTPIVFDDE